MRIHRDQSRLTFRKRSRRRSGCFSLTLMVGLLVGAGLVTWNWLGSRLQFAAAPVAGDDLATAVQTFARGDLDSTIDYARRALEQHPQNTDALILLVRALIYRSYTDYNRGVDRETALGYTTDALKAASDDLNVQAIHAFALQADGQPAEAARVAQGVLDKDPNNILAKIANAMAYDTVGSFDTALRDEQQTSTQSQWQLESLRAEALSYSDLGDYKSAIQTVEQALKLNHYLLTLYFERALYALQIGDTDSATAAYYQILTYDPNNVKVRLRLCELSSLLRERDAAVGYCQDVTQRAPDWSDGWYQLGMERFLQGNFQQAEDALHRCSTLQVLQNVPVGERKFQCWYLQGQAAEILGDCPNLIATYNEFRAMSSEAPIQQTWIYPPEGPPGCPIPQPTQTVPA